MAHEPLTQEQIEAELARLVGWSHVDGGLAIVYKLRTSAKALEFIAAVGEVAEELNHHPDLDWRYNRVILRFSSHDAGSVVTARDVEAADRCTLRAAALDAVAQPWGR
ncbi:4a-hydroxytetrahydrobiopterin dehydratase [Sinomonas sp. ASV486]|uniref:Putative pterin-4-alpha-carbinolamine dehydratase n=1 Tax=Sinomonas puerhi TaxID=3238584 RepID=A0AB39KZ33_9MICC|nr:4a-hydroxytetrahydrobiopterin dehydratase [Sinomonas sp. ASV486]MDQ4491060.1 4a-hydroxytetrahydrobiopterin dehydratase [Sinomonas sp. ASV486]